MPVAHFLETQYEEIGSSLVSHKQGEMLRVSIGFYLLHRLFSVTLAQISKEMVKNKILLIIIQI